MAGKVMGDDGNECVVMEKGVSEDEHEHNLQWWNTLMGTDGNRWLMMMGDGKGRWWEKSDKVMDSKDDGMVWIKKDGTTDNEDDRGWWEISMMEVMWKKVIWLMGNLYDGVMGKGHEGVK